MKFRFYNPQPTLFSPLFTYAQCFLKPTDLPESRLPKSMNLPKLKIGFRYNPQPLCLFISLFTHAQRLLKLNDFPK